MNELQEFKWRRVKMSNASHEKIMKEKEDDQEVKLRCLLSGNRMNRPPYQSSVYR